MKKVYVKATTAADGSASVTSTTWTIGKLYALAYLPGTIDTGATITVTCEGPQSKALLTKASAGTSNVTFYPRDLQNAVADGAALTGTAGGDRTAPILDGKIKLVVASGGNVLTGAIIAYYE
jgi:hypothetical protein